MGQIKVMSHLTECKENTASLGWSGHQKCLTSQPEPNHEQHERHVPNNGPVILESAKVMDTEKSLPDAKLDPFLNEGHCWENDKTWLGPEEKTDDGDFLIWWLWGIMSLFERIHTEEFVGNVGNFLSDNSGETSVLYYSCKFSIHF